MKIKSPFLNRVVCTLGVAVLKVLYKTTRVEIHLGDPIHNPYNPNRDKECIFSVWHDLLLFPLFIQRPKSIVALVGRHRDGDYVSNILKALQLKAIRGSSSRGGTEAVLQAVEQVKDHSLVVTPDGPRGPRRKMKQGCVFVAAQTGIPVVATAFSVTRAWRPMGSWTDLVIPKPFSKVYAVTSEPFYIKKNATREEISAVTDLIQTEMDRLNVIAEALAAGKQLPEEPPSSEITEKIAA